MTNEVATYDEMTHEQMAALTGQSSGAGNSLPRLGINANWEDEAGNRIDPGTWRIKLDGTDVYMAKPKIRGFIRAFMYKTFDPDAPNPKGGKGVTTNISAQVGSIFDEAIDRNGGLKCGFVARKRRDLLPAHLKAEAKKTQVYQVLYCTVEADEGKTGTGETVVVPPTPCTFHARGSNFMPLSDVIKRLDDAKKILFKFHLVPGLTKKKNGDTTYYVADYNVDLTKPLPGDKDTVDLLRKFRDTLIAENKAVKEKHDAALRGEFNPQDADIGHAVDDFERDFHQQDAAD